MKIILRLLIIFFILSHGISAMAQNKKNNNLPDTVLVKKGSRVTFGNMSFIPDNDTIIVVPDSIFFKVKLDSKMRSDKFYESIESRAGRSKFTQSLYDMTFVSQNRKRRDTVIIMKSEAPFHQYEGKVIRSIRITRLDAFGPSLYDTARITKRGFGKFLNKVHINSREWVIKQNIRIKAGDKVNSLRMAENERILRELPYIEDALISVSHIHEDSDSVDVVIITKDVWSISLVPIIINASSARFRLYDANFLGFGHNLSNKVYVNTKEAPVARYEEFGYETRNVLGSFIQAKFEYKNNKEEQTYEIRADRPFMPPLLSVAGGAGFKRTDMDNIMITLYDTDTTVIPTTFKSDGLYVWAGKTFPIDLFETENENKSYFTLSGKYSRALYLEHQQFEDENKYKYENKDIILASASISKNNYVITNLINSFGKTEDIPYGYNLTYTIGQKFGEYRSMFYSGLKFSYGRLTQSEYYLYGAVEYGGYIYNGALKQGLFQLNYSYISKLNSFLGSKLRSFIRLKYLSGIGRFGYDKIYLDDQNGFRGVGQDEELTGIKRLTLNLESVLFTPLYFLGFRFAAFAYIDNGFVSFDKSIIEASNYYMGLGLGVRIRNENLIFQTFQIDLRFYPIAPDQVDPVSFTIGSVENVHPLNFNPTSPRQVVFH